MRVLTFVGAVAVLTGVMSAQIVGVVVLGDQVAAATAIVTAASGLLVAGSLVAGASEAHYDLGDSYQGRKARGRYRLAAPILAGIATVCWVVLVPVGGISLWFAALNSGVAIALLLVAAPLGRSVGRMLRRRGTPDAWAPFTREDRHRILQQIAVTTGVTGLVVGTVSAAFLTSEGGDADASSDILYGVTLALSAAGLAGCFLLQFAAWSMLRRLRGVAPGDLDRLTRIAEYVVRDRGALHEGDQVAAARYAAVFPAWQMLSVSGSLLLLASLALNGVPRVGDGGLSDWYPLVVAVLMVGAMVTFTTVTRRQQRRVRRYAREHAHLLEGGEVRNVETVPADLDARSTGAGA